MHMMYIQLKRKWSVDSGIPFNRILVEVLRLFAGIKSVFENFRVPSEIFFYGITDSVTIVFLQIRIPQDFLKDGIMDTMVSNSLKIFLVFIQPY